jgi:hypothetical protein
VSIDLPERDLELPRTVTDAALHELVDKLGRNFDAIAAAIPDNAGEDWTVRHGEAVCTFGVGSLATALNVPHGLGTVPVRVFVSVKTPHQGAVIACHAGDYTNVDMSVQAEYVNGYAPGAGATVTVEWWALS